MLLDIKIDLTKVPKDKLFKSDKTGSIYLDCKVVEKQTPGQFGDTHAVYIQRSKDEEKLYIGSGKSIEFKSVESAPIAQDDLPF